MFNRCFIIYDINSILIIIVFNYDSYYQFLHIVIPYKQIIPLGHTAEHPKLPAPNLRSIYKQQIERINILSSWKMSQGFYFGMPRKSTNHAHHNPAGISGLKLFSPSRGTRTHLGLRLGLPTTMPTINFTRREIQFLRQVYGHCLLQDIKRINDSLSFEQIRKLGICAQ